MKSFLLFIFVFWEVFVSKGAEVNAKCCGINRTLECVRLNRIRGAWRCGCSLNTLEGEEFKDAVTEIQLTATQAMHLKNCFHEIVPLSSNASFRYFNTLTIEKDDSDAEFPERLEISLQDVVFPSIFQNMANLNLLELGIKRINENIFRNFSKIIKLRLSGNNLLEISNSSFGTLGSLTELDLSSNNISTIDVDSFKHLINLEVLNLNRNRIGKIPTGTFEALTHLEVLDLSRNNLVTISMSTLVGLKNLRNLNLEDNQISLVNFSTFNAENLSVYSQDKNSTSTVNAVINRKGFNLRDINLSHNKIQVLASTNTFGGFPKIKNINLSFNKIQNITLTSFSSISSLSRLNLSHNNATSITHFGSSSCGVRVNKERASPLSLILANNQFQTVPKDVFSGLCRLSSIDVSYNEISTINPSAFQELPFLRVLNLSNNKLEYLDVNSHLNLSELDLSSNSFTQASSKWLRVFSKKPKSGNLIFGGNDIKCDRHMAEIFTMTSCNRKYVSELRSKVSCQELLSLSQAFENGDFLSFPDPGVCDIKYNLNRDLNFKFKWLNTKMQKCVLQSLLDALSHSQNVEGSKNIFGLLLNGIEELYNDARSCEDEQETLKISAVKLNILNAINEIAQKVFLNASKPLLGSIGDNIFIGATDVTAATSRLGTLQNALSFKITSSGSKLLQETAESRLVEPANDCQITAETNGKPNKKISISLPPIAYLHDKLQPLSQRVYFVVYENDFLFPSGSTVASAIVSAEVPKKEVSGLDDPVVINACVDVEDEFSEEKFSCAYWSFNHSDWRNDGCFLNKTSRKYHAGRWRASVTCHCNHLTNFAVLLNHDPSDSQEQSDDVITNAVTISGLAISIISLIITIIYRLSIAELRRGIPHVILLHLCFNLLFLYIFFLLYDREVIAQNDATCFFIALCLHFLLLSVWGWQIIEGISMYLLIVRVFNTKMQNFLTKATISCYTVVVSIVAISMIFASFYKRSEEEEASKDTTSRLLAAYRYGDTCIIRYPYNIYFSVIPVAVAWFVNCVTFAFVIHALKLSTAFRVKKKSTRIAHRLRQAISISTLLGVTWCIGFAKVLSQSFLEPPSGLVWTLEIVFSALNSLQGFFIFLIFCVVRHYRESKCSKKIVVPPRSDRPSVSSSHPHTVFSQLSNRSLTKS